MFLQTNLRAAAVINPFWSLKTRVRCVRRGMCKLCDVHSTQLYNGGWAHIDVWLDDVECTIERCAKNMDWLYDGRGVSVWATWMCFFEQNAIWVAHVYAVFGCDFKQLLPDWAIRTKLKTGFGCCRKSSSIWALFGLHANKLSWISALKVLEIGARSSSVSECIMHHFSVSLTSWCNAIDFVWLQSYLAGVGGGGLGVEANHYCVTWLSIVFRCFWCGDWGVPCAWSIWSQHDAALLWPAFF